MKCNQFKIVCLTTLFVLFYGCIFSANRQCQKSNTGEVKFAKVFANHMVLQQNKPITIWGSALPKTKIVGYLGDEKRKVITDENGNWLLKFNPREASFKPLLLKVNDIQIEDILVGEVWLCSGQSNMQFQLKYINIYDSIKTKTANNSIRIYRHENIRIVAKKGYSDEELERCNVTDFFDAEWKISTKETAAKTSAIAWLFANGLQKELDVPIGILQVSLGGSALNNWIPPTALKENASTAHLYKTDWLKNEQVKLGHRERLKDAFQNVINIEEPYLAGKMPYRWMCEPGFLFEAGIAPMQNLSFRGVLWYQGESDTDNIESVYLAKECLPLMVNQWRKTFNQNHLPFIAIQLPAHDSEFWPEFREVQRQTIANLEDAYLVPTIDLGAKKNIHPKDKHAIGERAVHSALKNVYGETKLIGFPIAAKYEMKGSDIFLHINEFGTHMYSKTDTISGFEIADATGVFHQADAIIMADSILKIISPVNNPMQLRYAWMPFPEPKVSLYNSANLPLQPFVIQLKESSN